MKKAISLLIALSLLMIPLNISYAQAAKPKPYRTGEQGIVCLTFDDGYGRANITKILNTLREKDVKCTFFVIGSQLKPLADLWRQAIRDGHEIAYHSMHHSYMTRKSNEYILSDIQQWYKTAHEVLGNDAPLLNIVRLPGGCGHNSARVMGLYTSAGCKVVGWTTDTMGGVTAKSKHNTNARIRNYILRTTKVNTIILMHFDKYNANALPLYIDELKRRFRLGKVSDAIAAAGPAPDWSTPAPIPTPAPAPIPVQPCITPAPEPITTAVPEPITTDAPEPSLLPEPTIPSPTPEPTPNPSAPEEPGPVNSPDPAPSP